MIERYVVVSKSFSDLLRSACTLAVTILVLLPGFLSAHPNETIPAYHWIYDVAEKLRARGYLAELYWTTKPWTRGEIARSILTLQKNIDQGRSVLSRPEKWMLERLEAELADEIKWAKTDLKEPARKKSFGIRFYATENLSISDSVTKGRGLIVGDFAFGLSKRVFGVSAIRVDQNLVDDPNYIGKKWRGFAGYTERAYLASDLGSIRLKVGRDYAWWGPARHGNLILSTDSRPFDLLQISGDLGPVRATSLAVVLDPVTIGGREADSLHSSVVRRYLSGHRLSLKLFSRIEIGLSETVIYGGPDRIPEVWYLNPLAVYMGEQYDNSWFDDNGLIAFDLSVKAKQNIEVYGEFLVDDYQVEKLSPGDLEPNELGFVGGFCWSEPIGMQALDIGVEYSRIRNWTYNQPLWWNRYLHRNRKIGHPLGNDADALWIDMSYWLKRDWRISASYEHRRKGEGSIEAPWTAPWMQRTLEQGYSEPFPTGIVEKRNSINANVEYHRLKPLYLNISANYGSVTNAQHIEGKSDHNWQIAIVLSLWPSFLWQVIR